MQPAPVNARFMRSHPAHLLALGFGSGLSPKAPGTAGTLAGWGSFLLMDLLLTEAMWAFVLVVGLGVGIWCSTRVIQTLGVHDHPAIVWDEILAFWLILWVAGPFAQTWLSQLVLFGLFRFFDALKPPPIRWLDRNIKGGIGVMVDDLAAALATLFVYAVGVRVMLSMEWTG
ncbi:MAG: phosphatidylglycerophosphatase A [Burkholderiaceae bacterium]